MLRQAEFMKISPRKAAEWLDAAPDGNRNISPVHVNKLARDMRAAQWAVNGEAFVLDNAGRLLDGQHRCRAIIESGCTITSLVVMGVKSSSFDTLDSGRARTAGDVLAAKGISNPRHVATIARILWRIVEHEITGWSGSPMRATIRELETFIDDGRLEDIQLAVTRSSRGLTGILPRSVSGPLYYLFYKLDPESADAFFDRLRDGVELASKSPILMLRNRLMEDRTRIAKLPILDKAALTIKAWNAVRSGKPMGVLRWASSREDFPEIT